MGECFIMRRSGCGSFSNAFAVIAVTYPEGSICTCSNGTKTLRANDTGGACLFSLPEAGEWTVTITDGKRAKSKTVSITRRCQAENVALLYDLLLYDHGVKDALFDGYPTHYMRYDSESTPTTPTVSDQNGIFEMRQVSGDYRRGTVYLNWKTPIDFTEFRSVRIHIVQGQNDEYYLLDTKSSGWHSVASFSGIDEEGFISLDCSAINKSGYIAKYLYTGCFSKLDLIELVR